jgi:peptide/nickel transport system substrate-binding protein
MQTLNTTTDPAERDALLKKAQEIIAKDYVNGFLFQWAKLGVAKAGVKGLWVDAPTAAIDLTGMSWSE